MSRAASLRVRLLASVVALLAMGKSSLAVAAQEHRVVLLRPVATDELTTMALARIKGELIAAGFEVMVMAQREDIPPRTAVETAAPELRPLAVFAIYRDTAGPSAGYSAEIWVSDRVVDRTSVERMGLEGGPPERGATVLAVRAVELLKASLALFWVAPERVATKPHTERAPLVKESAPGAAPRRVVNDGLAVYAALGVLHSFGEIGPVWTPLLRLSYATAGGIGVRLTVGGLGSSAQIEAAAGSARADQELAMLEGFIISRWPGPLQLLGSVGLGAYHLRVEGTGRFPYRGKAGEAWSLLTGVGLGVAVEVHPHIAIITEADGFLVWPRAVVRFDDADVGNNSWPSLLASTGMRVTF